jgi:hypothetical protein
LVNKIASSGGRCTPDTDISHSTHVHK